MRKTLRRFAVFQLLAYRQRFGVVGLVGLHLGRQSGERVRRQQGRTGLFHCVEGTRFQRLGQGMLGILAGPTFKPRWVPAAISARRKSPKCAAFSAASPPAASDRARAASASRTKASASATSVSARTSSAAR